MATNKNINPIVFFLSNFIFSMIYIAWSNIIVVTSLISIRYMDYIRFSLESLTNVELLNTIINIVATPLFLYLIITTYNNSTFQEFLIGPKNKEQRQIMFVVYFISIVIGTILVINLLYIFQ